MCPTTVMELRYQPYLSRSQEEPHRARLHLLPSLPNAGLCPLGWTHPFSASQPLHHHPLLLVQQVPVLALAPVLAVLVLVPLEWQLPELEQELMHLRSRRAHR